MTTTNEHQALVLPAEDAGTETRLAETPAPAYVDTTDAEVGKRLDVIPERWQRANLRGTLAEHGGLLWHRIRWHGVRVPLYAVLVTGCVLRGAARIVGRVLVWWHWTEGWVLESQAVAAGRPGHHDAMRAHTEGKKTRATRGRIVAVCVILAAVAVALAVRLLPWWAGASLAAAGCVPLARHGRPHGKPLIRAAVVSPSVQPPTPEIVTRALASLGFTEITQALKDNGRLAFVSDVARDGPGWGVQVDLPHGLTVKKVIAKREELASGLRRPLSAVWPTEVPEVHTGRLDLWIGIADMAKVRQAPWPLARAGQADVFGVVPFGTDPRGRTVSVPLFEVNWLIGASPGQGKTGSVRVLACAAALDPLADLWIHELAGKGDLDLSRVCHRYTSGIDDEAVEYAAQSARMLKAETERRSAMFKKLKGSGVMPDGKVTRELAARYKALRPLIAIFDEVQNLFMDETHGKKAAADLAYAIRVGRAMGITVILATQRPNTDSVPGTVAGLIVSRFCLMVPGQIENDMVLGTSAFRNGYKATSFRPKVDAGLGWVKGSEDGIPQVVRSYYLNLKVTERIVARAFTIRQAAGVLSGYALGELDSPDEGRSFPADVLSVFGGDTKLWSETIAARLAEAIPGAYADITPEAVASQLRNLGVTVKDVRETGKAPRKGCERAAVEELMAGV